jgi:uncharacterized protein (UPF0210 family)
VGVNPSASSEYEAEANRLRAQIGVTIAALRSSLTPSNIASEAASRAGIADLSWAGAFDYAIKRHPVPTAIVGLGVALWTMSAVRNRARRGDVAALTSSMRESSASILDSATRVFRERAEAKRREFVDVAQAQAAIGAAILSDEIEKKLENIIDRVPGGINVRPLIEASIQVALAAALEGLLRRRSRQ